MLTRFTNWINGLYERAQAVRAGEEGLLSETDPQAQSLPDLPDVLSAEGRAQVEANWRSAVEAQEGGDWAQATFYRWTLGR